MKKISLFFVVLALSLGLAGCNVSNSEIQTTDTSSPDISQTEASAAPTEESVVGDDRPDIPDAEYFDEFVWPTFGLATKIPIPSWSKWGLFLGNETSETYCWVQVGYSTLDDFNDYVKACQDAGYTEDSYYKNGYMYYAVDSDGRGIQVHYNQWSHFLDIQVTIDPSDWDKSWEN